MSRPRKPTRELELKGAFRKDPARGRARQNEPKPTGPLGDPPRYFRAHEKMTWHEFAAILTPGVAGNSDRPSFAILCRLAAKERKYGSGGHLGITNGELSALERLMGKFGMNPVDRSKLNVPQELEAKNVFAQLAQENLPSRPN